MSAPSPHALLNNMTGKTWHKWAFSEDDEVGLISSSPSPAPSGSTSPSHSPHPPSSSTSDEFKQNEDVMKLPKRDMHIFGQFPVTDEFTLVQCATCSLYVKVEAFERHYRQRHDKEKKLLSSASIASALISSQSRLRPSIVKEESHSCSSSAATTPLVPSRDATPPVTHTVKSEPQGELGDIKPKEEAQTPVPAQSRSRMSMEEADSTTNNVISIPDTDQLPHSLSNDLMAMVESGGLTPIKDEIDSTTLSSGQSSSVSNTPTGSNPNQMMSPSVIKLQMTPAPTPSPTPPSTPGLAQRPSPNKEKRKPQREYHPDKHCGVWDGDGKRHCTRALTCKSHSVLLKRKIPGRSKSFDELVAEHKAVKETQAAAAAAAAAQVRVIQPPNSSALPPGISLLQPQPSPVSVTEAVLGQLPVDPNHSLDPVRFQPPQIVNGIRTSIATTPSRKVPNLMSNAASPTSLSWVVGSPGVPKRIPSKETDENLHYTTDHPKPLAVCTFGARRIGGLLVADRSQYLTRKIVRVAISAGGYHRIRPTNRINELKFHASGQLKQQPRAIIQGGTTQRVMHSQTPNGNTYQVSYTLSPATNSTGQATLAGVKRSISGVPIIQTFGGTGPQATSPRLVGGLSLASLPNGATVTANATGALGITAPAQSEGSFKTDVQDFKGGIKFEMGRNIQHILPTAGAELTK